MHVDIVPNRGSAPAILLRESYREAGKTRKRTLANLSDWPPERVSQLRAVLRGERLLPASEAIEIVRALRMGMCSPRWGRRGESHWMRCCRAGRRNDGGIWRWR
jgi:hypothetical protein